VRMDDPNHAVARREDLDQFRKVKFGRHKSYAYGENSTKITTSTTAATVTSASQPQLSQLPQSKRNTAPMIPGPGQVFVAANAARGRRTGVLTTLQEDAGNAIPDADDTDTDIGDSPCPPPTKTGMLKGKKIGRVSLSRSETYGPSRMALGC
jgi:M-phase inducer tyrosine phosphatase